MINPQALETFGRYDKKSLMAGVVVGQGLKGRARAPQTPAPAGFPQELWDAAAQRANAMIASMQGAGQSAATPTEETPDEWQFDKDAFCFGIAAGRSLEGWEIDGGVNLYGYSKIIYYIRLDSPCTVTIWLGGTRNSENLFIDWGDSTGENSNGVNYTDNHYVQYIYNQLTGYVTHDYENDGEYIVTIASTDTICPTGCFNYAQIHTKTKSGIYKGVATSVGDVSYEMCDILYSAYFEGISAIGSDSFDGCRNLFSVTIPNSVTGIGSCAFYRCESLTSLSIPDSVTSMGEKVAGYGLYDGSVFAYAGITSITIPATLQIISIGTFMYCDALTNVTISNGVTVISSYAFKGCANITSIIIPDSVTAIGSECFAECSNLSSINIPRSVIKISSRTFRGCGFSSVTIPGHVKIIDDAAFLDCHSLTDVIIQEGVTRIGKSAFSYCYGLANVIIPASIETIGANAFSNAYRGFHVYYAGTEEQWTSLTSGLAGRDGVFAYSYGNYTSPYGVVMHYNSTGPDDVHDD